MSAGTIALASSLTTVLYVFLLMVERRRGRRYAGRVRAAIDRSLDEAKHTFLSHTPSINQQFFRQLFHYIVHLFLALTLRTLQVTERLVRRISRINRRKAITTVVAVGGGDSHLQKIAEHKEDTALTEKEKIARKKAALRGDRL